MYDSFSFAPIVISLVITTIFLVLYHMAFKAIKFYDNSLSEGLGYKLSLVVATLTLVYKVVVAFFNFLSQSAALWQPLEFAVVYAFLALNLILFVYLIVTALIAWFRNRFY